MRAALRRAAPRREECQHTRQGGDMDPGTAALRASIIAGFTWLTALSA
jgi:hypothetical protein